ncbi:MAG: hypothetical protein ABF532_07785 [Bifidobacterium sp.]|nr:hypothetical protein [Bifidobacterium tibiigranuli]
MNHPLRLSHQETARKRHANGGIRCCAVSFQLIEGADEQPVADGS